MVEPPYQAQWVLYAQETGRQAVGVTATTLQTAHRHMHMHMHMRGSETR